MARVITATHGAIGLDEVGGGDSTPIVFLHGVGSDKTVWRPQLAHFGGRRRALAFDYPGYGDSDPAPRGTSRDDYAAAILGAMDALSIGQAHICGLSLGGVITIAIHHAAPARCASLILADSFAVHPDGRAIYDRSIAASEDMAALAEARTPALVAAQASAAVRDEIRATMARIDPVAFRIGAEAVWLADQRDRVAAIAVPTLVIVGEDDRVTPPELSRELAAAIPGARLEVVAGAGHLTNIEQPGAFNALIDAFVGGLAGGLAGELAGETIDQLEARMIAAADALDFEEAKRLRDYVDLLRGGASAADAIAADTTGLQRQQPGAMGLGTSRQQVTPPKDWRPPPKPDLMTRRVKRPRKG